MGKIDKIKITQFKKSSNIEKNLAYYHKLIKKNLPKNLKIFKNFIKLCFKNLNKIKKKDYNVFKKTNKSNNIKMQYNIMEAKKNTSFNLHIHPTIELIYIIKGKLYEDRFNKLVPRNKIKLLKKKTDLPKGKFSTKIHKKGHFLVNDIGTVHNSYTKKEGTLLLVLWCGKHHILST